MGHPASQNGAEDFVFLGLAHQHDDHVVAARAHAQNEGVQAVRLSADIGGKPYGLYPFILSMSPGRDDVIIMLVGQTEKDKILGAVLTCWVPHPPGEPVSGELLFRPVTPT